MKDILKVVVAAEIKLDGQNYDLFEWLTNV
jgi:hypothetical protein